jgi:hypothetical protein
MKYRSTVVLNSSNPSLNLIRNIMDKKWEALQLDPDDDLEVRIKKGCPLWKAPSPVNDLLPILTSMYPSYFYFYCLILGTDLLHEGAAKEAEYKHQYYRSNTGAQGWETSLFIF